MIRCALALTLASAGCDTVPKRSELDYRTVVSPPNRDPEAAARHNRQAQKHLDQGELDKAEELLHKALIADVGFGPAHNNLGKLYHTQGQLYLAAWEYEYAARLMPLAPDPHNNLGLIYEEIGKLDEAIAYYETAYALRPDNAVVIGNLVRARLKREGRDPEARRLLTELLMHDTRPQWVAWAREQLGLEKLPGDQASGAEVVPSPAPNYLVEPPEPEELELPSPSLVDPRTGGRE